ncbi:MAG: PDZ domain-containing protein, partial [bacterium]|nr:PDZ domain-containing protein [bacterium]
SGGPLLNLSGEAVGINTAISSAGQGIAFAIPIDQVKQILPQLKTNGKAARSGMGVRIENVSPELAKAFGFSYAHGALVREVMPGSAAYKAGVLAGDVITKFNGKIVKDASALQVMAGLSGVGKSVPVSVYRDGKNIMLKMTLEEILADKPKNEIPVPQNEKTSGIESIGLSVVTLDNVAREHLHLDKNLMGARVVEVQPRSLAQMAGIEPDDVIVKVNNSLVKSGKALSELIEKTKAGEVLRILLKRQKATIFIAITKP